MVFSRVVPVMLAWLASCSSTGSVAPASIIGEWSLVSDAGWAPNTTGSTFMFFNADGTYGEGATPVGHAAYCVPGTYRYENGSVYVTFTTNNTINQPVVLAYDTLTLTAAGVNRQSLVYTRENSNPANRCPFPPP